jgi:hypothetical protein
MVEGPERAFPKIVEWRRDEVERLGRRLEGLVLPIRSEDCQDLPPLREEIIRLPVSEETKRAARLVANTELTAVGALNKVRQLSDGFQYRADGPALRCETPKDDALRAFLARNEAVGRVIIYAPYTESVDRCVELALAEKWNVLRCDGRGWVGFAADGTRWVLDRDEAERARWLKYMDRTQDTGELEPLAFIAHPKSGGYALNLTAAREGLCFSADFDWSAHAQMLKRGHRTGMDLVHGFVMKYLCHLPTDAYVLENHRVKKTLQSYTLEELRRVLNVTKSQ